MFGHFTTLCMKGLRLDNNKIDQWYGQFSLKPIIWITGNIPDKKYNFNKSTNRVDILVLKT